MRCGCCDKTLSETEVSYNTECDQWEYCTTCLLVISEVFEDHLDEDQIVYLLDEEWGDYLSKEKDNTYA